MNDNKYYTPTIEEFHVGFEYEMKSTFGDGTVKTIENYNNAQWDKCIYTLKTFPYVDRIMNGNNPNNLPSAIRVKYLDCDDIKTCGFTFDDGTSKQYSIINKDNDEYSIYFDCLNRTDIIRDGIGIIIYNDISEELFRGYIKNKSEFTLLLKQLNIL